jgi:hypothetical protein
MKMAACGVTALPMPALAGPRIKTEFVHRERRRGVKRAWHLQLHI